jgi:hypothetical protein
VLKGVGVEGGEGHGGSPLVVLLVDVLVDLKLKRNCYFGIYNWVLNSICKDRLG